MIKVVSFDIGNTIIKSSPNGSLKQLIRKESVIEKELLDIAYKEHFITKSVGIDEFCDRTLISKDRLLEIIFYYKKGKKTFEVWNDVQDVLLKLRSENIEIIAISNKAYVNPYTMKTYGLEKYFKREIYSCDIGYAKPDVSIFSYAAKGLCMPSEIIHVGDSMKADYLGAIHAGWRALLLDREGKFEKNKAEINTITELDEIFHYVYGIELKKEQR